MKHFNFLSLFIVLYFLYSCSTQGLGYETKTLLIKTPEQNLEYSVEIADTEFKRTRGLMYRTELADNSGMFFVFSEQADHSFWMKDTGISLDILFLNSEKEIVYIEENTVPYSQTQISSEQNVLYVLEINAGHALENDIHVGDEIEIEL